MNSLEKKYYYNSFCVILFFSICWTIESFLCVRVADDAANTNITIPSYLSRIIWTLKLGGWSSRFLIDPIGLFLLVKVPYVVWKIVNSILMSMQLLFLNRIFNKEKENFYLYIIGCCTFLFPYSQENSAGWCFTTVTYYWPIIASIISFYYVKKILNNDKLSLFQNIIFFISILYASDDELGSIFLLTSVIFIFIGSYIENKKLNRKIFVVVVVCLFRFILHIFWQMFATRKFTEISVHYPDFFQLSFVDKLQNGFSTCCHLIFIDFPQLTLLLSIVLVINISISKKDNKSKIISLLAPLFLLSYMFSNYFNIFFAFEFFKKIDVGYSQLYGLVNFLNFSKFKPYIELFLFFIILGSLAFSIFSISRHISISLTHFGIFLGGFLSRCAMGFSPTICASGLRTFSLVQGSLMICLIAELFSLKKISKLYFLICSYACISFGIISILKIFLETYSIGR